MSGNSLCKRISHALHNYFYKKYSFEYKNCGDCFSNDCKFLGVADQLQTNYASDLRHILKAVFECNASEPYIPIDVATATDKDQPGPSSEAQTRDTDSTGEPSHREEETAGGDEPEDDMELPAEGAEEADESMTASPRRNNICTEVQSANQPSDEAGSDYLPVNCVVQA